MNVPPEAKIPADEHSVRVVRNGRVSPNNESMPVPQKRVTERERRPEPSGTTKVDCLMLARNPLWHRLLKLLEQAQFHKTPGRDLADAISTG